MRQAQQVLATLANAASVTKLAWYGRRLRTMGKQEVFWRAGRALLSASSILVDTDALMGCRTRQDWERALERFRLGADRPTLLDDAGAKATANRCPGFVSEVIDAAQAASERTFRFFGYPPVTLGQPMDWHSDPIAGVRWPLIPSERINHRIADGDVQWIWELNRLQHLPWLAQAWLFTGDERYSSIAFEHLDSWIEHNPPGFGIAWRGAFAAGIRAISIVTALQGLRTSPCLTVERYRNIVNLIALSASKCWHERSRFQLR